MLHHLAGASIQVEKFKSILIAILKSRMETRTLSPQIPPHNGSNNK